MYLLDKQFVQKRLRYLLQCVLATLVATNVLAILNIMTNKVVIASLGASCFIVFCVPHRRASGPRLMIGGYIVAIAVGSACYWLGKILIPDPLSTLHEHSSVMFGGLAIGLVMFLMVVTNTKHPPAASLALGLTLGEWSPVTIAVAMVEITLLCILKKLLKPLLIDLI